MTEAPMQYDYEKGIYRIRDVSGEVFSVEMDNTIFPKH